jgi:hypothetical protein
VVKISEKKEGKEGEGGREGRREGGNKELDRERMRGPVVIRS